MAGILCAGLSRPVAAAKRGDTRVKDLQGASKSMYKSMTEKELDELASTSHKGKPEHVDDKKK